MKSCFIMYAGFLLGAVVSVAAKADVSWTGAADDGGNVLTDGNWYGGTAPGSDDAVVISTEPDAVLSADMANWKSLTIGSVAGQTGMLKVLGGSLNLSPDSPSNLTALTLGGAVGASGVLEIDSGTVNAYSLNTPNYAANATVNMKSGTLNITHWVDWGRNANGNQVFNHTGGDITVGGNLWIGRQNDGTGVWNMSGGTLTHTGGTFELGHLAGTSGLFTQDGGDVSVPSGDIRMGEYGNGFYTLNDGSVKMKYWLIVGRNGTGSFVHNDGDVTLVDGDNQNGNWLVLGQYSGSTGTYVMNGGSIEVGTGANGGGIFAGKAGSGRFELNGGTVTTPTITEETGTSTVILNGGTIKVAKDGGTDSSKYASDIGILKNIDRLVFGRGTTIDTNGHDTKIVGCGHDTIAGSSLVKTGTGTLTVETLPPVETLIVSNGVLAVDSSSYTPAIAPALAHRWSLNGDLNDSVGGSAATTIGKSKEVNYIDGAAVRTGADQSDTYATALNLGTALTTGERVTIEIWATRNSHTKDMRVFDWGPGTEEYICIGWNDNPVMWFRKDNKGVNGATINNCFADDIKYHIVMTISKNTDGSVLINFVRRRVDEPSDVKVGTSTVSDWDVSKVLSASLYLGHSQWPKEVGNDANATYDEVRVWNCVLSDEAIAESCALGPDATTAQLANLVKPTTIEVASGATLDLGGNTITQRVFSCVGTIANGTLEVAKGLAVTPGQTMTVADGATLDLSAVSEVSLKDASSTIPARGWVVATSPAGGIVSDRAQLKLAGDLAGYTLFVTPTQARIGKVGLIITFY